MKRLIALDQEEFSALTDLSNAHGMYAPSYQTINFTDGFYYIFSHEESAQVEKILLLGARAGLTSP